MKKVVEVFAELLGKDTDFSICGDRFIRMCVQGMLPLSLENLEAEIEAGGIDVEKPLYEQGIDFFGYGEDYEGFATDWVVAAEREIYLTDGR